jgi:hypothetical protein
MRTIETGELSWRNRSDIMQVFRTPMYAVVVTPSALVILDPEDTGPRYPSAAHALAGSVVGAPTQTLGIAGHERSWPASLDSLEAVTSIPVDRLPKDVTAHPEWPRVAGCAEALVIPRVEVARITVSVLMGARLVRKSGTQDQLRVSMLRLGRFKQALAAAGYPLA